MGRPPAARTVILTVTANPAVDVTYRVSGLVPGAVHRVSHVSERLGGKGVNVARVLRTLDEPVTALLLADVESSLAALRDLGVEVEAVLALPALRRTLVVQGDDGATTSLWEPGLPVDTDDVARRLVAAYAALLPRVSAVAVSGSLPPGLSSGLPAELAGIASASGVPVVLDVDGAALLAAVDCPGVVLTPNLDELAVLAGRPVDATDALEVAHALVADGVGLVVATLGRDGLLVVDATGAVRARLPEPVEGNPTGAGDAACAAVVRCLAASSGRPDLADLARTAVALSASSVLRPVAGEVDLGAYRRFLPRVVVQSQ